MIAIINAGELRDKIIIQQDSAKGQLDERGFPVKGIVDVFTLRAKRKTINTKEYLSADRQSTDVTYKFITYKRNINSSMFINYKGRLFDIKNVHEFDDGMFVEITAVERS